MNAILNHIVNMWPYMVMALIVWTFCRAILIRVKTLEFNPYREAAMLIYVVFVVGLLSQAVLPKITFSTEGIKIFFGGAHRTNLIPFNFVYEVYYETFVNGNISYLLINILGNIIMFIPIGILIPLIWKTPSKATVLCGFGCSAFIEITQIFLPRSTDVDDLLLNTLGTFIGWMIFYTIRQKAPGLIRKFHK